MRLRHKPWAKEKLVENSSYVIPNPEEKKGKWHEVFGNKNPIHIEVGTGKGRFITEMALENPEINYIGIELQVSVIVGALERIIRNPMDNCKLLNSNADDLSTIFEKGEVDRVYLNFSDPWPKTRHEKRRLTYKHYLDLYKNILINKGEIHFKTDNQGLFEYSLMSFSEYGLMLKYVSLDLHNSKFEGNIMTEYEEKFSGLGNRIFRSEVQYQS